MPCPEEVIVQSEEQLTPYPPFLDNGPLIVEPRALTLEGNGREDVVDHRRCGQHHHSGPLLHLHILRELDPMLRAATCCEKQDDSCRELLAMLLEEGLTEVGDGAALLQFRVPPPIGEH